MAGKECALRVAAADGETAKPEATARSAAQQRERSMSGSERATLSKASRQVYSSVVSPLQMSSLMSYSKILNFGVTVGGIEDTSVLSSMLLK